MFSDLLDQVLRKMSQFEFTEAIENKKIDLVQNYFQSSEVNKLKLEESKKREVQKSTTEGGESIQKKTIEVDSDFVSVIYDNDLNKAFLEEWGNDQPECLTPPSLKTIAAAAVHNDSGYEGNDSSKKLTEDSFNFVKRKLLDDFSEEEDLSLTALDDANAKSFTALFDRHADEDYSNMLVEFVMMMIVFASICYMIFMGDLEGGLEEDSSRLGGKRAAIKFYYDSLERNKYF